MINESKSEPKKKDKAEGAPKGPAHVLRDGGIAAMVWRRESATGFPYYEYSLSRSWKSQNGKTGYSQNYFARNEAQLVKVIELASRWISEAEAKDQAAQAEAMAA